MVRKLIWGKILNGLLGNDIDATINPAEAALMWTVRKEAVRFYFWSLF